MSQLTIGSPTLPEIFNPRNYAFFHEEFLNAVNLPQVDGARPAGMIWRAYFDTIGYTDFMNAAEASSDCFGGIVLSTGGGAVDTAQAGIVYSDAFVLAGALGGGLISYKAGVRLNALSDVTDPYAFFIGIGDNNATVVGTANLNPPANGIYIYHDDTSGFWMGRTAVGGVSTTVTSAVAPVAGAWTQVGWEVSEAGTRVDFFVGGVNIGNSTTNIPTDEKFIMFSKIQQTVATANERRAAIDYVTVFKQFSPAR